MSAEPAYGASGLRLPTNVHVTLHAKEMFCRRFPELTKHVNGKHVAKHEIERQIRTEVRDAFASGRVAKRAPRFLLLHDRTSREDTFRKKSNIGKRKKASGGHGRFAWEETEERAYVVSMEGHNVVVISCLSSLRKLQA